VLPAPCSFRLPTSFSRFPLAPARSDADNLGGKSWSRALWGKDVGMRTHFFWPLALLALCLGETHLRAQELDIPSGDSGSGSRPRARGWYVRISGVFSRTPGGPMNLGRRTGFPVNLGMTAQPIVIVPVQSSDGTGVDLDVTRPSGRFPARDQAKPENTPPTVPAPTGARPTGSDVSKLAPSPRAVLYPEPRAANVSGSYRSRYPAGGSTQLATPLPTGRSSPNYP
jgi:hypothetical protein